MTRTYDPLVNSYLSQPTHELRMLIDVTYTNTTQRFHTGVGSLMVGATHYDGVAGIGGIDSILEDPTNFTPTVRCYMSVVDSGSLPEALSESLFNKRVLFRRAWLLNGTVVNTPEVWFDGRIGSVQLKRGDPERGNYFDVLVQTRMERKRLLKYFTREYMTQTYSGDTFFNYLSLIQGQQALWGQKATYFGTFFGSGAGGGGGGGYGGGYPAHVVQN